MNDFCFTIFRPHRMSSRLHIAVFACSTTQTSTEIQSLKGRPSSFLTWFTRHMKVRCFCTLSLLKPLTKQATFVALFSLFLLSRNHFVFKRDSLLKKIYILPFNHSHVVPNWTKKKDILWRMLITKPVPLFWKSIKTETFRYQHSSKYHLLCSTEERKSYSFGIVVNRYCFLWQQMPKYWKAGGR